MGALCQALCWAMGSWCHDVRVPGGLQEEPRPDKQLCTTRHGPHYDGFTRTPKGHLAAQDASRRGPLSQDVRGGQTESAFWPSLHICPGEFPNFAPSNVVHRQAASVSPESLLNMQNRGPTQTYSIRICILTNPLGKHSHRQSAGLMLPKDTGSQREMWPRSDTLWIPLFPSWLQTLLSTQLWTPTQSPLTQVSRSLGTLCLHSPPLSAGLSPEDVWSDN